MIYARKVTEVWAHQHAGEPYDTLPALIREFRDYSPTDGAVSAYVDRTRTLWIPVRGELVKCLPGDFVLHDGRRFSVMNQREFEAAFERVTEDAQGRLQAWLRARHQITTLNTGTPA